MTDIHRDPQEVVDVFAYNLSMLEHLCSEFDKGRTEAALWIAVILRTLLRTHRNPQGEYTSYAVLDQLKAIDNKYDVDFLSTAYPLPESDRFNQGWRLGDGVCGLMVMESNVYAGLLVKTINRKTVQGYVADVEIKGAAGAQCHHRLSFDEWWNEIVFRDNSRGNELSRWDVVRMIANKDGGAHFSADVPVEYDTFRHPDLFEVSVGGTLLPFSRNPVYVSVRQIAWEVQESLKGIG